MVKGFACPDDPSSSVVGGFMPLVRLPMVNRSPPPPESGLGVGHNGGCLVVGPLPMWSDQAQPKEITQDLLPVSSPPTGGAKGVKYIVCWVAAESRDLGSPILGCRS